MKRIKQFFMRFRIPSGQYCANCPYWEYVAEIKLHREQSYGFDTCEYADACDGKCWESNASSCKNIVVKCKYLDYLDTRQESLLWDKCKECGVKDK